jgi:hypothetical protein
MTVNQLHKLLCRLIDQGHGRRSVCIDKPSFRDNRENDGLVIMPVWRGVITSYPLLDDDGALTERMTTSLVLVGDGGPTTEELPVSEPGECK